MISELKVGPQINNDGAMTVQRSSKSGATVNTDAHGRYQEAVLRGNVYRLAGSSVSPTAFVGATGGTPLCSIYNPVGSGKIAVILMVSVCNRVTPSGAGTTTTALWNGVSVANAGTLTTPTNVLSGTTGGSSMQGSVNAATTNTTAVTMALPINVQYWATAAGAMVGQGMYDVAGAVVCYPGTLVAFGVTVIPTSYTADFVMIWEEVSL